MTHRLEAGVFTVMPSVPRSPWEDVKKMSFLGMNAL